MILQACLNGPRARREHPGLPVTPAELAEAAREAVAAGAVDLHVHPKDATGADTLDPAAVADTVSRVRAAVPGVPIGVTTGAWAVPDPRIRAELVRSWTILPDHASVNWHEDGADLVAAALTERGVAVEAGLFSGTDAVTRFRTSPFAGAALRILAEVMDTGPDAAEATAGALLDELGTNLPAPVLLHGQDGGAWPVLRLALRRGLSARVGLEDVLHLPDGSPATGNAALVRAAAALRVPAAGRGSGSSGVGEPKG
ncbi:MULTISPECIES: 3-keto-5-aminohexanoate cleavage protein [Streptomyces]|uniref:3-keto-5-aminohexanoate cleavage protein n=1 Tax=Streptomyces TaxID=1883 RepID=UPI00163C54E0|nr:MULTISPECIES: 3-keto-5-aminohexanoate cleavage protein [Streptomyces]MBC2878993.1 3-keto-5-aminohexanoate cleavage protein [Streptomyces sp. TYQ1024]UBI40657.1 3-keto-5-aminohexanoate cleavage protein [Streptomyces mobaraensis]UKW33240.1 3-keto-5-aminohexanoate cleavage protein [Streptomyces sp. TYQ1024]